MKKTPWFRGSVLPARRGVYERYTGISTFSYWNGQFWGFWSFDKKSAYRNRDFASAKQRAAWRGLTTKDGK